MIYLFLYESEKSLLKNGVGKLAGTTYSNIPPRAGQVLPLSIMLLHNDRYKQQLYYTLTSSALET